MRLERKVTLRVSVSNLFQFHKGAIRTPSRFFDSLSDRYFNSIKVRLEHDLHKGRDSRVLDFNSIKVRLEPRAVQNLQTNSIIFQFHKGAIRTLR